ncbi:MAG: hypothetical protein GPJ54_18705 [Candidatus Heimdallarchaeota archaeon]|nr:hypothetical protein [Candidatus Heimdallarchaeota archaeon]
MSKDNKLEFFVYDHKNREFKEAGKEGKKLTGLMGGTPEELGKQLTLEDIDALLVLDNEGERWYLSYADTLGIIGQRTARRQADTIARSGYRMPAGYTIKGNYPMVETNDVDIGDLWKTVQQKYVISDLSGMALDEETGIPAQLADRAELMKAEGHSDDLTEAKLEKEEAEVRKRAMARSSGDAVAKPKPKSAPKSAPPQAKAKPEPEPIVEEEAPKTETKKAKRSTKKSTKSKKKSPKKAVAKKQAKKKTKKLKASEGFFEISSVKQNVIEGSTQSVCKGKLNLASGETVSKTIVFDQEHLTQKEWTQIGLFMQKGDIVQIGTKIENEVEFATSIST